MKERILTNWTFTRVLYLVMGLSIGALSIINAEWLGLAFGAYFATMGLFAFACASGNCGIEPKQNKSSSAQDIVFEEVK